jgi:hypothetical protein
MRIRASFLAIGALAACAAMSGAATEAATAPNARLRAFDGCGPFRAYVTRHALLLVGAYGLEGSVSGMPVGALPPGAARDSVAGKAASDAYSGTNVQEDGVDEPDLAKTNGRHLFVVVGDRLRVVDVRRARPRLVGTLRLPEGAGELLLRGNRLLVLSRAAGIPTDIGGRTTIRGPWPLPQRSRVTEVDVRDPSRPRIARTLELGGSHLAARLVGSAVRLVVTSPLGVDLPFERPATSTPAEETRSAARNADLVRATSARGWLPSYAIRTANGRTTETGSLVQCRNVSRPPQFSGLGLVTVLTLDLDRGLDPIDSDAVVSDGRIVYASKSRLYVATERWDRRLENGPMTPISTTTQLHAFDVSSPTRTSYRASGVVPGTLLSQWSLSEHGGILRVASTERPLWWGGPQSESETSVTTFAERGGTLVQLGRVDGLGRGDRVYAVRFAGDVGYVVTFRQVDPLYTIDLSRGSRPVVRGELKIRGYSSYLHAVGDGLLLGIGQDATDEGRVLGFQASLFDVSDLRRPQRLAAMPLGPSWSAAEGDHHAFLWWPRARLAVIPLTAAGDAPFTGALGLKVGGRSLSVAGRVAHVVGSGAESTEPGGAPILRSFVVGDALYTVSELGVKASSLTTFVDLGFARFSS